MRSMYTTYPQYHSSLDNKDFISFRSLCETIDVYEQIIKVIEMNRYYRNLKIYGEPQLGKYGLYPSLGGPHAGDSAKVQVDSMMWLLNLADGGLDLLSIAERSGIPLDRLSAVAARCVEVGIMDVSDAPQALHADAAFVQA